MRPARSHRVEGAARVRRSPCASIPGGQACGWFCRPRLAFGEAYMDGKLTVEDGSDIYDLLDLLGRNMAALEATPFVRWSYRWQRPDARSSSSTIRSAGRSATSRITTTSTTSSTISSSTATGSIPAPTSRPATSRSSRPSSTRSTTSPPSCCCSPARRCSTSARAGAAWASSSASSTASTSPASPSRRSSTRSRSRRALEGGLADRVRFKLLDYRQEHGRYDRIVSVGMFEHVGVAHYVEFFPR